MMGWPYDCGDSTCLRDHSIVRPARHISRVQPDVSRCTGCEHEMQFHDVGGRCWFTVASGLPGANLVCPCKIRKSDES